MGDPYWRYSGAGGRPSSSEIGHVPQATFPGYLSSEPQATFPGYLSSETSTLANYNMYSSVDPRAASSDFLHKDILSSRSGAYGIDDIPSVRAEPGISGLVAGASYKGYPSSYEDPNLSVRQRDVASGINAVKPDDIPSVRAEPGISGLVAGASYKGYPSSYEDPNLSVRQRDVASGINAVKPDVGYDQPSSITRTDGNTVPAAESNILFIDGLPTDCTRREIGHLFRPFIGFREIRLVHKEPRRRGDKAMVLCFVEFTDAKCAVTAMEALQGYKFDDKKPEAPLLKIHFAHFPFHLPSDRDDPRAGVPR